MTNRTNTTIVTRPRVTRRRLGEVQGLYRNIRPVLVGTGKRVGRHVAFDESEVEALAGRLGDWPDHDDVVVIGRFARRFGKPRSIGADGDPDSESDRAAAPVSGAQPRKLALDRERATKRVERVVETRQRVGGTVANRGAVFSGDAVQGDHPALIEQGPAGGRLGRRRIELQGKGEGARLALHGHSVA